MPSFTRPPPPRARPPALPVRVLDADRRVRLERAPEAELLADLAHGGQHLLAEQPDAGAACPALLTKPSARPEAQDRRPRLLEEPAELRDHGLRRARDDLLVRGSDPRRRRRAGWSGGPPRTRRRPCGRRREVARRARPHRVREAGELALHPHELPRVGERLLLGLGDVAALQIAAVLGAAGVARLRRHRVVELPDLLRGVDRGAERDVRIALLRRPDDRLLAEHAGNPDARVRLLQRHRPRVHHAVLVVRALPAERAPAASTRARSARAPPRSARG